MVRGDPLKDGDGLLGASPTPRRKQQGQAQGSPLLYFRTATDHIYGVYASVLHHPKVGLLYLHDDIGRHSCQCIYICAFIALSCMCVMSSECT